HRPLLGDRQAARWATGWQASITFQELPAKTDAGDDLQLVALPVQEPEDPQLGPLRRRGCREDLFQERFQVPCRRETTADLVEMGQVGKLLGLLAPRDRELPFHLLAPRDVPHHSARP